MLLSGPPHGAASAHGPPAESETGGIESALIE
jgi:hypothetical protein